MSYITERKSQFAPVMEIDRLTDPLQQEVSMASEMSSLARRRARRRAFLDGMSSAGRIIPDEQRGRVARGRVLEKAGQGNGPKNVAGRLARDWCMVGKDLSIAVIKTAPGRSKSCLLFENGVVKDSKGNSYVLVCHPADPERVDFKKFANMLRLKRLSKSFFGVRVTPPKQP